MSQVLIKGGRIIDIGASIDAVGDLLIRDGMIAGIWVEQGATVDGVAALAENGTKPPSVVDATGCVVCPGFIDLHAHLREPGYEDKETIETGTRAAAAGGFTTVCCMPNTNPAIDNPGTLELVVRTAQSQGVVRVLPIAAITKNRAGAELAEMAELARAGAVGFSDDGRPVVSSRLMRYALDYSRMLGKPIMEHSEDLDLAKDGVMHEGVIATKLGMRGIPGAAEDIAVARNIAIAQMVDGHLHVAHVSTAGSVELIRRAKEKGIRVTAEVTPHHLTLTDEWVAGERRSWGLMFPYWGPMHPYNTNTKVNPPLRTQADVAALIEGLKDGTIDAIATDHAPHTIVDKLCEYDQAEFGISGFETALGSLMALVHRGEIEIETLIARMTTGPAGVIGLPHGNLNVGSPADVVVFDPDEEWTVSPEEFRSKGKNTPLDGLALKGRVVCTVCAGEVVFARHKRVTEEIKVGPQRVLEVQ
ncbi:MAG: dihydroorotase [Chloroflexi bacterium]|nr:dihydroorotase [Chloroflexota bacterium]